MSRLFTADAYNFAYFTPLLKRRKGEKMVAMEIRSFLCLDVFTLPLGIQFPMRLLPSSYMYFHLLPSTNNSFSKRLFIMFSPTTFLMWCLQKAEENLILTRETFSPFSSTFISINRTCAVYVFRNRAVCSSYHLVQSTWWI